MIDDTGAQVMAQALAALDVPDAPWIDAGEFCLLLSGQVMVPDLPASPGIVRIDRVVENGSGGVAVMLSEHDSMRADDPVWTDPLLAKSLAAGEQSVVYFLDADDWPYESPDLRIEEDRMELIRYIEQEAEASGHWEVQVTYGDRILVVLA